MNYAFNFNADDFRGTAGLVLLTVGMVASLYLVLAAVLPQAALLAQKPHDRLASQLVRVYPCLLAPVLLSSRPLPPSREVLPIRLVPLFRSALLN